MRYAIIENEQVVSTKNMPSDFDPDDIKHKFDFRPIVELVDPVLGENEKLGVLGYVVNPDIVDAQYTVEPMTQAEIDARDERDQDTAEAVTILGYIAALGNGTGTTLERLRRTEKVSAWLLKQRL